MTKRIVINESSNPVHDVRKAKGLSVEEFAKVSGYPAWWIEELEKRHNEISLYLFISYITQAGIKLVLEDE